MPYLILDLDLTLICAEDDEVALDRSVHTLYPTKLIAATDVTLNGKNIAFPISIINPLETSNLIDAACSDYDGIIILTAGCWSEHSIKPILKDHLNVSPETQVKIEQADYLNPINTMDDFLGLSRQEISLLVKKERFRRFLQRRPDLQGKHFVFLDDSSEHTDSFAGDDTVRAIRATTNQSSKAFYQEALNALARAKRKEMGEPITPGFDLQFEFDDSDDFDGAPIVRRDSAPANLSPTNAFFTPSGRLRRTQSAPDCQDSEFDEDLDSSYDTRLASDSGDEFDPEHYLQRTSSYEEYMARHQGGKATDAFSGL